MSDRDKTGGKRRGAGSSSALNEPKKKVAKTNQASVSAVSTRTRNRKSSTDKSSSAADTVKETSSKSKIKENHQSAAEEKEETGRRVTRKSNRLPKKLKSKIPGDNESSSEVEASGSSEAVPENSRSSGKEPGCSSSTSSRLSSSVSTTSHRSSANMDNNRDRNDDNLTLLERLNSPYYDCFGHKLPTDPAEGIDKIIPYDLEKWKCDICSLECANRVGLINHRKTHWKGKTPLHRRQQHQPPPMAERNKTPQENPEPCPSTSRESSDPEEERLRPTSAQSPLLAATADAPDIDAFAPMEDDFSARKAKRLKEFSTSQLLEALVKREKLYKCHCGAIFQDSVLYHLHRGSHHDEDPMRCAFCKEKMKDWYAFQTHFFQHKRKVDD